jgi:hypothetical protein
MKSKPKCTSLLLSLQVSDRDVDFIALALWRRLQLPIALLYRQSSLDPLDGDPCPDDCPQCRYTPAESIGDVIRGEKNDRSQHCPDDDRRYRPKP